MAAEPEYRADAFVCPHCGVESAQDWYPQFPLRIKTYGYRLATCQRTSCGESSLWVGRYRTSDTNAFVRLEDVSLVWPAQKMGPEPHDDAPDSVKRVVNEARETLPHSPRAAAALVRLAAEDLVRNELGGQGRDFNDAIADLVKKGVPEDVHQDLDVLRHYGNVGIHPGEIDNEDTRDTVLTLLEVVNELVERLITAPRAREERFKKLPESKRKAIEARNRKALGTGD